MLDKTKEALRKVELRKPADATGEIAEIFEDIRRVKGPNYLTPTWGFFALDVDLLRHWWGLTKRLQGGKGDLPKPLLQRIPRVWAAGGGLGELWGARREGAAWRKEVVVQEIKVTVKGGYSPDVIVVKQGVTIKLDFYRDEAASCSEQGSGAPARWRRPAR